MDIRSQRQWVGRTLLLALVGACGDGGGGGVKQISYTGDRTDDRTSSRYVSFDLVSDQGDADVTNVDENLVNAWGLAYGPETPFWVANEGSGTATAYTGTGEEAIEPVRMPEGARSVTGLVFHGGEGFELGPTGPPRSSSSRPNREPWSPGRPRRARRRWVVVEAPDDGSAYTGLAIAEIDDATFLYAANFKAVIRRGRSARGAASSGRRMSAARGSFRCV